MVTHFAELHTEMSAISGSLSGSGTNEDGNSVILEKIGSIEHAMLLHGCLCLTDCQPLTDLITEKSAASKLLNTIVKHVQEFFSAFTEVCQLVSETKGQKLEVDTVSLTPENAARVQALRDKDASAGWSPLFCLALVRI